MGTGTPFVGTQAFDAGAFTQRELRRSCTRIYRNVYQRRGGGLTAKDRAVAAWLWSGRKAVVAGNSAAALHGAEWVDPHAPAEFISGRKRPPPLIVTRKESLLPGEVTVVNGVAITSRPAPRLTWDGVPDWFAPSSLSIRWRGLPGLRSTRLNRWSRPTAAPAV